jgi:hypothetical protein
MAVEDDTENVARKVLGCAKKTSCVLQRQIITNPLPGYD